MEQIVTEPKEDPDNTKTFMCTHTQWLFYQVLLHIHCKQQNKLTHQMKHKLHNRCSDNQSEHMAIFKALNAIQTIKIYNNTPRKIMIHTNSETTLESLKNTKNRKHLIEEIRKKDHCSGENNLVHRIYLDKGTRRTLRKGTRR